VIFNPMQRVERQFFWDRIGQGDAPKFSSEVQKIVIVSSWYQSLLVPATFF
jgi:hypothetical protein